MSKNVFTNLNYEFFAKNNISNPIVKPFYTTEKQSREHNYTQQIPKPVSQLLFFSEIHKILTDATEK